MSVRPNGSEHPGLEPLPDAAPPAAGAGGPPEAGLPASEEGAAAPDPGPVEAGADELRDRWLRAEAELQNLRRRAVREREEAWRAAEEGVLLELIAVLDDLERALEAAREAGAAEAWIEGVQLTAGGIRERLARYGVTVLDPLGQAFDPRFHEALLEIDAPEKAAGAVVQVVQRGYARGDRALRAARVVVARLHAGGEG